MRYTYKIFNKLSKKYKIYSFLLLILSIVISVIEMLGISLVFPFIQIISDTSIIFRNKYYHYIYQLFNFTNSNLFLIFIGCSLIAFYLLRAILNIFYVFNMYRFLYTIFQYVLNVVVKNLIHMSYVQYASHNKGTITNVYGEIRQFIDLLTALLCFLGELFVLIFIYCVLLYVNAQVTLYVTSLLLICILLIHFIFSPIMKRISGNLIYANRKFNQSLLSFLHNFKLLKLIYNKNFILSPVKHYSEVLKKEIMYQKALPTFPKYVLENLGFIIIISSLLFIVLYRSIHIQDILPTITIYCAATYRLLPSVNRLISYYQSILSNYKFAQAIFEYLNINTEQLGQHAIEFKQTIKIKNICFKYPNNEKNVLFNVNMIINKGSKIGIFGSSGSGKTTLIDMIIGIHQPQSGSFFIDDVPLTNQNLGYWRDKIGYIPQDVYLFDDTVANNVIFGLNMDRQQLISVLKKANIWDFLQNKDGIDTRVGDGGIQLSGGQKQRIGIARALYKNPEVLVLDEATSALDTQVENSIMDEVYNLKANITLLIISHRLDTIKKCDKIFQVSQGSVCPYEF